MVNTELAIKIREAITAKPELWSQGKWASVPRPSDLHDDDENFVLVEGSCATTMCIAGWACHLSGEKFDWTDAELEDNRLVVSKLTSGAEIETRAEELLGVNEYDVSLLFYAFNETVALDHLDQVIEYGEILYPYRAEAEEED